MGTAIGVKRTTVFSVLWNTYIRNALIPIIVIELALIGAYLATNYVIRDENIAMLHNSAQQSLQEISRLEASGIKAQLDAVSEMTTVYAARLQEALDTPYDAGGNERQRYATSPDGVWHTTDDNGGAALYYSALTAVGEPQREKAWRLAQLDPLMKQLVDHSALVTQIYFNSYDSMNRIYPFFKVEEQYPARMNIPEYNFYYDADASHNPGRGVVWTDVYIDPAGQGWMTSAIAPVYRRNGDFLEGVAGLDIQVSEIIQQVLSMKLAWNSYALLLDSSGTILAMPRLAEADWNLKELTQHDYQSAILEDTFKPEDFNVYHREDTRALAERLQQSASGMVGLTLNGQPKLAAWARIPGANWHLLVVADEGALYADANALKQRFDQVALGMILGLILFYLLFMAYLYRKSLQVSRRLSQPMKALEGMIQRIGEGDYTPPAPRFEIRELQHISDGLLLMGAELAQNRSEIQAAQERMSAMNQMLEAKVVTRTRELEDANQKLRGEQSEQTRLISQLQNTQSQLVQSEKMASVGQLAAGVAHEINNPLAFVSANIGCMKDYAIALMGLQRDTEELLAATDLELKFGDLQQHYDYPVIREEMPDLLADSVEGVRRIKRIVDNLLEFSHIGNTDWQPASINHCVETTLVICRNEYKYKAKLITELGDLPLIQCIPSQINQVVLALLVNAAQAIEKEGEIRVRTYEDGGGVVLSVCDTGCGIEAENLKRIFDPFYTTKEVGQGTGLGLAVAYGIVTAHQGRISVESEPGKGSCFNVWLPMGQQKGGA